MKSNHKQLSKEHKEASLDYEYKKLFTSPLGEQVLNDLKKVLRYGQTVYQPGRSDRDNAFEQGRQSVINDILFFVSKK